MAEIKSTTPLEFSRGGNQESSLFMHLTIGGLATVGFYVGFERVPWLMQNYAGYFIGHPVEYVATYLFFCGLSILCAKWLGVLAGGSISREIQATLVSFSNKQPGQLEVFQQVQALYAKLSPAKRQLALPQRLHQFLSYMQTSGTAQGLGEHLQQHGNMAYDRYQRSYGFFNTAVWAIPILGFLGTVLGITIAIAHVTPEQLTSSLQEVTKGLAIAFDTTAQSLALSFVLVFAKLLVSTQEEKQLAEVDQTIIDLLLPHFVEESASNPLDVHAQTSQEMFQASREMVSQHIAAWSQATGQLRQQWSEISLLQSNQLSEGLEHGLTSALQNHYQELRTSRDEYTQLMSGLFEESSRRIQRQEMQLAQQHVDLLSQQQAFFAELNNNLQKQVLEWRQEATEVQHEFKEMTNALLTTSKLLTDLQDSQEQLSGLQMQLSQNLQLLRTTDTFEQTLETLNAAVHLLSARSRNAA
jgi:biopolymer transport protein ExbB/TolQ